MTAPSVTHPAGRNLAIASLCLGLVAVVPAIAPISAWLSLMLSIAGLVLGLVAVARDQSKFSLLAVLVCALVLVFGGWSMSLFFKTVGNLGGSAPVATHSSSSSAKTPVTKPFGETLTYPSGLAITVSEPAPFTPSPTASGDEGASNFRAFTVTFANGSSEGVKLGGTVTKLQADGGAAERLFDSAKKISTEPSVTLLPGKSAHYTAVFALPENATELQLEVTPNFGFGYSAAIFTRGN